MGDFSHAHVYILKEMCELMFEFKKSFGDIGNHGGWVCVHGVRDFSDKVMSLEIMMINRAYKSGNSVLFSSLWSLFSSSLHWIGGPRLMLCIATQLNFETCLVKHFIKHFRVVEHTQQYECQQ